MGRGTPGPLAGRAGMILGRGVRTHTRLSYQLTTDNAFGSLLVTEIHDSDLSLLHTLAIEDTVVFYL